MYLNCNQGVDLEKTVAVADGEIEGRLHYVSWHCMVHACACIILFAMPNKSVQGALLRINVIRYIASQ